jgi:thioesterase domain-containing protein
VHDVRGHVLLFAALSTHFGPDQPVYGLQPRDLRPDRYVFATIEEMAERYLREVRAIQPAGPYRLAGACFGGVVAFEMARQLEAAGERVDLLALLDAFAPGSEEVLPRRHGLGAKSHYLAQYLWLHARALTRMGPAELWDYVLGHAGTLKRRVLNRFWVGRNLLRRWSGGIPVLEPETFEHAGYCAHKSYVPKPYGGSAVLFRARERSPLETDLKAGWEEFIHGGIEVCEIPGDHLTMLSHPNRSIVAEELARWLGLTGSEAAAAGGSRGLAGAAARDQGKRA